MGKDYYEILGVGREATPEEIKKAYREAALRHHPDRNPGDREAEERFKEATEAYQVLSDPEKRGRFDTFGDRGVAGPEAIQLDLDDVLEIFQGVFGLGSLGASGRRGRRRRRGADVRIQVDLAFEESYMGARRKVTYRSRGACDACGGTGSATGTKPEPCPSCGGRGEVQYSQGFLSLTRPCSRCKGRGVVPSSPCGRCRGSGDLSAERTIEVDAPAGVMSGHERRFQGRGEPSDTGGPPGDLLLRFNVKEDGRWQRDGMHLVADAEVPFWKAALGGPVEVPVPGGRTVTVRIQSGVQHGKTVRARGWGFPGAGGIRGDLFARVRISIPRSLTQRQRELLEAFAAEAGTDDGTIWDKVKGVFR